jgi:hypothetical protein
MIDRRAALLAAALGLAVPAQAGTLLMTYQEISLSTARHSDKLPKLTLGFANDVDYSLLGDPLAGPLFTSADLVFATWEDPENIAFVESNPRFENPPLTQGIIDRLTVSYGQLGGSFGDGTGIVAPVSGNFLTGAYLVWVPSIDTTFVNGPMLRVTPRSGFSDEVLRASGNWDGDSFNDAGPNDLVRQSVAWDPSATAFAAVPVPSSLALALAAMGALASLSWLRRRSG